MITAFAPGRVNLIGEHVDYHGLPVLPMALERGIRLDFRSRADRRVILRNADPRFGERTFALREDLEPGDPGDWGNYAMAAAVTVAREYGATVGIEGTLESDLPAAAGLSSSAALVVVVARALLHAAGIEADPLELATRVAEGERFVGTAGGGMDQAASIAGQAGHALLIHFEPLGVEPVALPSGWSVIVAHSGVTAEKSGGAKEAYNVRRRETESALVDVIQALGLPADTGVPGLLEQVETSKVVAALESMGTRGARWAVHTVTENARLERAVAALRSGDLQAFGRALDGSHESLRDVYEVSHPRLDRLVEAAREAGAAGARLTGAGFGGCILAVCRRVEVPAVQNALMAAQNAMDPRPGLAPFVAEAGAGARVEDAGD